MHFFITSEKYPSIFCFQTIHFHSQNYLYSSVHILLSMSRKTQLEILSKRRQSYKAAPDMIPSTHSLIISALLFLNFCPLYSSFPPLFSLPSTFFNLSLHIYAAFSFVPLLLSHHQSSCATLIISYLSKPFFPYENSVQSHPSLITPISCIIFIQKKDRKAVRFLKKLILNKIYH